MDKAEPDFQTVTLGQSPIQHCALTHDTVHSSGCGVTALREYQICHRAKSGNPLEQIRLHMDGTHDDRDDNQSVCYSGGDDDGD